MPSRSIHTDALNCASDAGTPGALTRRYRVRLAAEGGWRIAVARVRGLLRQVSVITPVLPLLLPLLLSPALRAESDGIPYVEIVPDHIDRDPGSDIEIGAGSYADQSLYTEIYPDRYSGGTEDPETVYREMGERYDSEEMVIIEPAADPALALPEPTVVPVDGYSADHSVVTPAGTITMPTLSREDRIFKRLDMPGTDPDAGSADDQQDRSRPAGGGRVILPPARSGGDQVIEIGVPDADS